MRTLVHLSDIHFGRVDGRLVEPLVETIHRLSPDVLAVSGDLTQRARRSQFIRAREFLQRLPFHRVAFRSAYPSALAANAGRLASLHFQVTDL